MTKIVKVKKKHIVQGKACLTLECPIALAVKEATGLRPQVLYSGTWLYDGKDLVAIFKHSDKIKNFIDSYDLGRHVKPFSFKMDI